jgi:uncharacterized membrane protein
MITLISPSLSSGTRVTRWLIRAMLAFIVGERRITLSLFRPAGRALAMAGEQAPWSKNQWTGRGES